MTPNEPGDSAMTEQQFHAAVVQLVRDMMDEMQTAKIWDRHPELTARVNALLCAPSPVPSFVECTALNQEQRRALSFVLGYIDKSEGCAPYKWVLGDMLNNSHALLAASTPDSRASIAQSSLSSAGGVRFIVKGSGETDLPVVHIVRDLEAARHAVLSLMYSDPADAEDTEELFAEFDENMADDGYWTIGFEIGGISVERVCIDTAPAASIAPLPVVTAAQHKPWSECTAPLRALMQATTRDSSSADAVDAQRYRKLKRCGAIVDWTHTGPWKFDEDIDAAIDKAIRAQQPEQGEGE